MQILLLIERKTKLMSEEIVGSLNIYCQGYNAAINDIISLINKNEKKEISSINIFNINNFCKKIIEEINSLESKYKGENNE